MDCDMTGYDRLELKPDYEETKRRWEAFWSGDIIDRPIIRVWVPLENRKTNKDGYYERLNANIDVYVAGIVENAPGLLYMGESLPQPGMSFGCDEVAACCGGDLYFNESSPNTCWGKPFVDDWESAMPLSLKEDNPYWLRKRTLLDKCAEAMRGKMLFRPFDLLTNLDLLMGMRGSERLCMDLIECPDVIEQVLEQAFDIFEELHERAYKKYGLPGPDGLDHLQCDFSCMISGAMFDRFALPYLEREAEVFGKRVFYHWDGPGALKHAASLIASKNIYVLGFVPGIGNGKHKDYLDIYQKAQNVGKAIWVGGTADEIKYLHKSLKPHMTVYDVWAESEDDANRLLEWFVKNT